MERPASFDSSGVSIQEAEYNNILDLLQTIYWKGVTREVCQAILTYQKIEHYQPDLCPYEIGNSDIEGINFKKFCTLLTPHVQGDETFDSKKLYEEAVQRTRSHLSSDCAVRRSRYLLEALGLLDIDSVHDSMDDPTIGRHCHNPRGEILSILNDTKVMFREMLCEACQQPLREYFYYECEKGCYSPVRDLYVENSKGNMVHRSELTQEMQSKVFQPPVRLCVTCIGRIDQSETCNRSHCRKKLYSRKSPKGLTDFEKRLRNREFRRRGSSSPVLRKTAFKLFDPSHYANAGPIHFTLTFGPLMIENGVPDSFAGAVVSCRPLPSMLFQLPSLQLISSESDAKAAAEGKSFVGHIFDDKQSGKRMLRRSYRTGRNRYFLGSVKRVCGGAFSGHNTHLAEGERAVVSRLCEAKTKFEMRRKGIDWVSRNRRKLQAVSQPVLDAIREAFGHEIYLYLTYFAKALANTDNPLRWDLQANNCQDFSTNLLKGLPIEGIFHPLPGGFADREEVRNKTNWPFPHYLLSFGPHIDTPMALLRPQPRSLIWNFYHKKRDDCDIIEFGEAYRTKPCAMPTQSWEVLDGFEDTQTTTFPLVDALWSIPRDSISIIQTHLLRGSSRYSDKRGLALSEAQWVQNRLRVFHQLDMFVSLSGGLVAALMGQLIEKRRLISRSCFPYSAHFGTLHAEERIVRCGNMGNYFIYFISGRERDWHKREIKHYVRKLRSNI